MKTPRLSVSIVHHDGAEMLRNCLTSIQNFTELERLEVIVVDNASTDGARKMMQEEFPWVHMIASVRQNGFAYNQNLGIRSSNANYVLVLNDDTLVRDGAVEKLCACLDKHPDVAVVGPKLLNADGTLQDSCYRFPTPLRHVWDNFLFATAFPHNKVFGDYRKWDYSSVREVDCIKGAALLVRRSAMDNVGLLDERFYFYFEEIDWQMRMHKAGYKILLCPDAEITHLGNQSLPNDSDRLFSEFQASSRKFTGKHYGPGGIVIQTIAITCGAIISIFLWSTIKFSSKSKQEICDAQIARSTSLLKWWLGLSSHAGIRPN